MSAEVPAAVPAEVPVEIPAVVPAKVPQQKKKTCRLQDILVYDDIIEEFETALLEQVFLRPPLFDYTLPIIKRSPAILHKLWLQVSKELTRFGVFEKDVLVQHFRKLRDEYSRFKNTVMKNKVSGSGFAEVQEPNHINLLRRLDAVHKKRK